MKTVKIAALSICLAAPLVAGPARALEPITQEKHINTVLLQGFIADKIADTCPSIEPRKLRALNELIKLRDYALKQGYKADEVRAFVEDKAEKARGKAQATEWLKKAGAAEGDVAAHCKVGRDEIARNSLIGYLLRDKG